MKPQLSLLHFIVYTLGLLNNYEFKVNKYIQSLKTVLETGMFSVAANELVHLQRQKALLTRMPPLSHHVPALSAMPPFC